MFSLVICNTMFSVGCGFIAGFSRTTVCNAGFRLCFSGHFRRIRHSLFPASSTLYFHLEFVIWIFFAWKVFQKLLYSSLLVGWMTSRAHSNGCNTGDLWLGRLVAFHHLPPSVASTSCPLSRNPCTVAKMALRGCFMLTEWCFWTGFL